MNLELIYNKKSCFYLPIDYCIYILLLLYVFIDCLTGAIKIYGGLSPAVPYRILLIILMTLSVGIKIQNSIILQIKYLFYFYLYTISLFCILRYLFNNDTSIYNSLAMILRISLAPIIYIYIQEIYIKKKGKIYIERIIKVNIFVLCINLLLGLIGYGENTYDDGGFGIKGFFYDGNALGALIFCIFVYFYLTRKKNKLLTIFFIIIGIIIGTKVSILGIMLYLLFVNVFGRKKYYTILIIFLISLSLYVLYINNVFAYHIEKMKLLYTLYKGNILTIILSGRNIDLLKHIKYYNENFNILQFLFGYGYLSNMKIIELDLFDTFFSYGMLFFSSIFIFYIYIIIKNRHNKKIFLFNVIYLLISMTSGHVWYNTSSALFFGIINAYIAINKKPYEKNILYK